jgi:hypothetical protein
MTQKDIRNLQSVGKSAFANHFSLYQRYSSGAISLDDAVNQHLIIGLSNSSGAKIRLSNAKVLFRNGVEFKALFNIVNSKRVHILIKQKAVKILKEYG